MNFWDHLGELRRRFLICLYALVASLPVSAFLVSPAIQWFARPVGDLVFVAPMEAFSVQLRLALGISFLIVLPVVLYQAWGFVSAGLTVNERSHLRWFIPSIYVAFMAGAAFAALVVFPKAMAVLLTLKGQRLIPMLSVSATLDFFLLVTLAFGLLFELPLAILLLAKIGILDTALLTHNRKLIYFVIFVLASVANPGPDVFTQLLMAGAGIALFELSIVLVRWENRPK